MKGDFMTNPFREQSFDDDLHTLVTIAVLTGQRGLMLNTAPIYEAWSLAYPNDALGPVGKGLALVGQGNFDDGVRMIAEAAKNARTRSEQAKDVLRSLETSVAEAV